MSKQPDADDAEGTGFLSRWSRRKLVHSEEVDAKAVAAVPALPKSSNAEVAPVSKAASPAPTRADSNDTGESGRAIPKEPAPTMDDVLKLGSDSDFRPYLARDVAPDVRNAAMKKLFSDPRFNVMDGLDVYIDDYSKPDPIPESMLREMVSARFLNLFDEKKEEAPIRVDGDSEPAQSVAELDPLPTDTPVPATQLSESNESANQSTAHANPDLRLQPDDAAPGKDPGRGA